MALYLGVDGGQSSTKAVIGDESGRILGMGTSGPCNHVKTGEGRTKFVNAVIGAVGAALESAGLPIHERKFDAACLGFSGGPADKEALVKELIWAYHLQVTTDAHIALYGATNNQPGLIVISGTGSIAFGRNAALTTARAGGWGYVFGDEGGAFDIARRALRTALKMEEGWGPATSLHGALLDATGAANMNQLMHWWYTEDFPRPRIATFAQLVDREARAGDEGALHVLHSAAFDLAGFAAAVRSQLFPPGEPAVVSCIGSTWSSEILKSRFTQLVELTDGNRVQDPAKSPAEGALLEAYRLAGVSVSLS